MKQMIRLLSLCLILFSFLATANAQTGDIPVKDIRKVSREFLKLPTTKFKVVMPPEGFSIPSQQTMAWDNVKNLPWTSAGIEVSSSKNVLKIKAPAQFFKQWSRAQISGEKSVEGILILITGLGPNPNQKVRVLSRLKKMIVVQRRALSETDRPIWEVVLRFQ